MNFCGKNPPLRQAAKRYAPLQKDKYQSDNLKKNHFVFFHHADKKVADFYFRSLTILKMLTAKNVFVC